MIKREPVGRRSGTVGFMVSESGWVYGIVGPARERRVEGRTGCGIFREFREREKIKSLSL